MDHPVQRSLDPSHQLTESDINESQLPEQIGLKWKDLARELGFRQSTINMIEEEKRHITKECCVEFLVQWIHNKGTEATVGKLKEALERIKLKDVAENLISGLGCCCQRLKTVNTEESNAPYQINRCDRMICELSDKLRASLKEVSKVEAQFKALELELSKERQMRQDKEQQVSRLSTRIAELEEELSIANQKGHDENDTEQHQSDLSTDSDQLEHRVDVQLRNINDQLHTYVTSPLQVQEVKQDQLRTAVKLDLLTKLSERLQELYTETLGMVKEASKCSEDLRKDFYDLAYHGLRAEHYELVHRVKDLESAQEEMSEEENKEFDKLQSYQRGRQSQVDQLDKLWRYLFTPPDRRQKTAMSADPVGQNKPRDSKKATRYTDPGDVWRKPKGRGEDRGSETPSTSNDSKPDEESRLNLRKMKSTVDSVIQTFSKKKDSGEKQMRDC
ncbi:unnamed protein product [Porites lobata]|uniref:Death domain-containing protein n=1 Tax=Porites lobata TaxID=104759 RepID=A0ABN8P5X7_9CNID|nr:unnamed protein product [Porites lobata]